jgi:D-amino-acid dehydrogenase
MKSTVVLGAGMVGVATALQLQRRGWSVTLVDHKEPGRETSYGNAGIIQSEALRPAPMPRGWRELMGIARGRSNNVRYQPMALLQNCSSLLRYWWYSSPERHERIATA